MQILCIIIFSQCPASNIRNLGFIQSLSKNHIADLNNVNMEHNIIEETY